MEFVMGSRSGAAGAEGGRSRAAAAAWSGDAFATSVNAVAGALAAKAGPERASPSGRDRAVFGADKVFIGHAYTAALAKGYNGTLHEFKQALMDAHRTGAVSLSRADLVEAMDPGSVRRSEIQVHSGGRITGRSSDPRAARPLAEFHFIRTKR